MPCLWQSLATARPMPEAAPVMRAVLPALNTGWRGMVGDWGTGGEGWDWCVWRGEVRQWFQIEAWNSVSGDDMP